MRFGLSRFAVVNNLKIRRVFIRDFCMLCIFHLPRSISVISIPEII